MSRERDRKELQMSRKRDDGEQERTGGGSVGQSHSFLLKQRQEPGLIHPHIQMLVVQTPWKRRIYVRFMERQPHRALLDRLRDHQVWLCGADLNFFFCTYPHGFTRHSSADTCC